MRKLLRSNRMRGGYSAFILISIGSGVFVGSLAIFILYGSPPWTITCVIPGMASGYLVGRGVSKYSKIYRRMKISRMKRDLKRLSSNKNVEENES